MKILFAATPEIAVPCLGPLSQNAEVEVLTNLDAPAGRSGQLRASPVKVAALELGLKVHQPSRLDAEFRASLKGFDLLVSFAYGKIFGPRFLELFPWGGLNVHPSLLPRWRGASPLTAAILAGDLETGICVQTLALGMDEGDLVGCLKRPLEGTETTESLTEWASKAAPGLLLTAVARLASGERQFTPQQGEAVYCQKISKEDGLIDWKKSAHELEAQVRAFTPWPASWTFWRGQTLTLRQVRVLDGEKTADPGRVLALDKSEGILVQTGSGLLALRELQLAGKKTLDFRSFANGTRDFVGSLLGEET